jgi:hypothetical protein
MIPHEKAAHGGYIFGSALIDCGCSRRGVVDGSRELGDTPTLLTLHLFLPGFIGIGSSWFSGGESDAVGAADVP